HGRARMVDVGAKPATARMARARAILRVRRSTWELVRAGALAKGDALAVSRLAGSMAAKETARLIPLFHPVPLISVEIDIREERRQERTVGPGCEGLQAQGRTVNGGREEQEENREAEQPVEERVGVIIEATARTVAQTGVEMEAL